MGLYNGPNHVPEKCLDCAFYIQTNMHPMCMLTTSYGLCIQAYKRMPDCPLNDPERGAAYSEFIEKCRRDPDGSCN